MKDMKVKRGKIVFPRSRGASIWQFLGDVHRGRLALAQQKLFGTRTLMEVDDNYAVKMPKFQQRISSWANTIGEAKEKTGYSIQGHRIIAKEVDGIIVSTPYLAEIYSELNRNIWVCPNSIDPADWQHERVESDVFRIGYYGSGSHVFDAPFLTKALKWAAKQPGVEVRLIGWEHPSWTFPRKEIPWSSNLAEARKPLFELDLGLAPLKENPWSRGKSDVKILEYGMAGAMPLMSRAEPFRPWFSTDLVLDDGDWFDAIKFAVENRDWVKQRAASVRDHILEHRTIESSIDLWKEAIGGSA